MIKSITRRHARLCALQALYSWKLSKNDIALVECYIIQEQNIQSYNISYFHDLYVGVINCTTEFDELMKPYLSRDLKNLGYVEHVILHIALFELTKRYDVPYKVVINEAIELTKIFGASKSHKFVNGVLDRIVNQLFFLKKIREKSK